MAKNKGGRPRIEIDWKLFDGFCQMQCTLWEIACYFNCSEDTIENRVKEQHGVGFSEYYGKKRIAGLMSLRRTQFRMAEKSPAMAIFLGKNYLGQADRQELTGEGGGPIKMQNVKELTDEQLAIIAANGIIKDHTSKGSSRIVTPKNGEKPTD